MTSIIVREPQSCDVRKINEVTSELPFVTINLNKL